MKYYFTLLSSFIIILSCKPKQEINLPTIPAFQGESIAFGSCNDEDKAQPLWNDILNESPKLWIWLGDNIYGDTEDMALMAKKYEIQNNQKDYAKFKSEIDIIGTWDDHDYGVNDGDKSFPKKMESKNLALNFLGVAQDAPVRNREGMFQSFEYTIENQLVRIVLLDTRYFRDFIAKENKRYVPGPNADILGNLQWAWLEKELDKTEDVLIIASGIQFIPEEHRFEKWANFPSSRNRLFELLNEEETRNIILLSGDRHIGEISKLQLDSKAIYEITSSGLTHSYTKAKGEANKHRIGNLTNQLNFGMLRFHKNAQIELMLAGKNGILHQSLFLE